MDRVGCYQPSRGDSSCQVHFVAVFKSFEGWFLFWVWQRISQSQICFVSRSLGNLLVKTWLQSMPFDFNPIYFRDSLLEQWCLNKLCPLVASWSFKEWRNRATPFVSSKDFQVTAGLREQIYIHLLPSFLTKLQIFHCLLSMTHLLPSGRRCTGDISRFWEGGRLFSILVLCSHKECLLELSWRSALKFAFLWC